MPPTCPKCPDDRPLSRNGHNESGTQRWRCKCGYSMTDSANTQGRPRHGEEPLTNAERQALFKERQRRRERKLTKKTKPKREIKMLVIFAHELTPDKYTTAAQIDRLIAGFPTMPSDAMKSIEGLEMTSFEILQEIELGKGYGNLNTRSVYFAWDLPFTPSIGWMFSAPCDAGEDCLSTITNIYFGGKGDTLLCDYE